LQSPIFALHPIAGNPAVRLRRTKNGIVINTPSDAIILALMAGAKEKAGCASGRNVTKPAVVENVFA